MSRAPRNKFKGPLVSPLAIKFEDLDTDQPSCLFLSKLVPEIRNLIYEMVLAPEQPVAVTPIWPFPIDRKVSLALLVTCRQIYMETHMYPIQTNMHLDTVFPCNTSRNHYHGWRGRYPFLDMSEWQKSTINEVSLIVSLCHLCFQRGPALKTYLLRTDLAAHLRKLHLYYVAEARFRLGCPRAKYYHNSPTDMMLWDWDAFEKLEEITIEFESGVSSVPIDLKTIVKLAMTWTFYVGKDRALILDPYEQDCTNLVVANPSSSVTLRWIEPNKIEQNQ